MNKVEYNRQWRRLHPGAASVYSRRYKESHPLWYESYRPRARKKAMIRNPLRIKQKGKWFKITRQRVGVCNLCRSVAKIDCRHTQWHHDEDRYYDEISKNIIELCPRCHARVTGLGTKILGRRWTKK